MAHPYILTLILVAFTHTAKSADEEVLVFNVTEELPPGTFVANLKRAGSWYSSYNNTVKDLLTVDFVPNQPETAYFEINNKSGDIYIRTRVDRDSLARCVQQPRCSVPLDIYVGPSKYFRILKISVVILDVNDNRPRFSPSEVHLLLPESSSIGSRLAVPAALDVDSPQFGITIYKLAEPTPVFTLSIPDDVADTETLFLVLSQTIDYESVSTYVLHLEAYDSSDNPESIIINITVTDVNDNPPEFVATPYAVTVSEDIDPASVVLQVFSYDSDTGEGGHVRYSFSERTQRDYGDIFHINDTSGWINLKQKLDYETETEYTLTVVAKDMDKNNPLSSDISVTITVSDVNDNAPKVFPTILADVSPTGRLLVPEHGESPQPLVFLLVEDADSGQNGHVSCTVSGQYVQISREEEGRFIVQTKGSIDREQNTQINFNVTCVDHALKPLSKIMSYIVDILDTNDNIPQFAQSELVYGLLETLTARSEVAQITATDPDLGENGTIVYTLQGRNLDVFRIDSYSGRVALKESFKPESLVNVSEIHGVVTATDRGSTPLSETINVTFVVIRRLSHPPVPVHKTFTFSLPENSPIGTEVGQILLEEKYSSHLDFITFQIDNEVAANLPFSLSQRKGIIKSDQLIDREEREVYSFLVHIEYVGQEVYSSVSVSVIVRDLNDNSPVLDYPNMKNHTLTISNKTPLNTSVARVIATDQDNGQNSFLIYKISPHASVNLLKVNSSNGYLYLTKDVSDTSFEKNVFDVRVEDNGIPKLSASGTLTLVINSSIPYTLGSSDQGVFWKDNLPWIASIIAAAVVLVIIVIIVSVVVRRQCATDKKYNDMAKKLDQLDNNNSMEMDGIDPGNSTRGSDTGSSFRHKAAASYENILRNNYAQMPFHVPSEADSDSNITDVSNADSGRGSINRGPVDGAHLTSANSLCHTYIPEDGVYVPDLAYRVAPRHTMSDRVRPPPDYHRSPAARSASYDFYRRPGSGRLVRPEFFPQHHNPAFNYGGEGFIRGPPPMQCSSYEDVRGARQPMYYHHPRSWSDSGENYGSAEGLPSNGAMYPHAPGPYYRHSVDIVDGRRVMGMAPQMYPRSGSDGKLSQPANGSVRLDPRRLEPGGRSPLRRDTGILNNSRDSQHGHPQDLAEPCHQVASHQSMVVNPDNVVPGITVVSLESHAQEHSPEQVDNYVHQIDKITVEEVQV